MKRYLLVMLAFLIAVCSQGQTLNEALTGRDTALALRLIKNGANPNATDGNGATLLMGACRFPDIATAGFLLRNGAGVDKPRSPKGRTPLMVACAYWSGLDMVKLLIAYDADVNAAAEDGTTPLMLAAMNEKLDVVAFLLAKGAKVRATDAKGKTALDYAREGKVEEYMTKSIKDTRFDKDAVIASLEKAMH